MWTVQEVSKESEHSEVESEDGFLPIGGSPSILFELLGGAMNATMRTAMSTPAKGIKGALSSPKDNGGYCAHPIQNAVGMQPKAAKPGKIKGSVK